MLLGIVVQALACVDALDEAEHAATAGVRAAADRGALIAASTASFHRAIPRLHRGALGAALADLQAARRPSAHGWSAGDPWIGALLAQVQLELGDLDAARAALALTDGVPEDSLGAPLAAVARAQVALAAGEPRRALELAEAAGRTLEEGFGIAHPGLAPWRCIAAVAARAAGDVARAECLGREALAQARLTGEPRSLGLALRTAAATGAPGQRVERLEEAVAVLETSPGRLQHAHALVDLGTVLRRAGRRPTARSVLRDGLQLAAELGAAPLADRAREELRATGARPRRTAWTGAAALTPSERRVAELAATGLTNDQIAQRLVVAAKTVQTHLTNAYRKLGITSRGELAAALAAR
jgi:DNA-binding CsgD family transcriptional regulator